MNTQREKIKLVFKYICLEKCSNDELEKLFWVLDKFDLNDEANVVTDFLYLRLHPPMFPPPPFLEEVPTQGVKAFFSRFLAFPEV